MTQPTAPAGPPTSAPPAPTQAPPAGAPPTGQPTAPQPGTPVPQQGWPQQQQAPQGYQQPAYPQGPPLQYVPVMPIPPTLAQPAPGSGDQGGGEQDLSKLPQYWQKIVTDLREENAKRRVSERTAHINQHAWMAAQQLGANAQAVLGSLAWQQAAEGLDPSSPDFGRHLAEAIHRTVQQNPWMAAQQQAYAPPVPGQPAPPGTLGQGQPPAPGGQPGQPGQPPQGGYPGPAGYPPYPGAPAGYQPPGYPAHPQAPGYPQQPPPGWLRPPTSGAEFAGGNGGTAPITEEQLAQMTPNQIKQAYDEGRLKHLM